MVAHVNFLVEHAKVEVVAGTELRFRHDEIVAFSAHHNPNRSAGGLENIFFYSALSYSFEGFGESLPKKLVEVIEVVAGQFACCFGFSANMV
jgi:hypothetical protein